MEDLKILLEVAALIVFSVLGIFGVGRWFGWRHSQLASGIEIVQKDQKYLRKMMENHIEDEEREFKLIKKRQDDHHTAIKELKKVCENGVNHGAKNRQVG